MKRKTLSKVLGCLLAVALLTGILAMIVSADQPTIAFVNPLGRIDPAPNQPLKDRLGDLGGKTIRLLQHGAANSASQLTMTSLQAALNSAGATALAPAAFGGTTFDARTAAQYTTWATGADAVIIGVIEDNVAAWWVGYHAREIEARGVPVVVVTTERFYSGVMVGAQDNGFAAMRVVTIPNSPFADSHGYAATAAARGAYITNNIVGGTVNIGAAVRTALTAPLTPAELSPAPLTLAAMGLPLADGRRLLSVPGTDEVLAMPAFYELSMAQGFGDGLPLVIPTQEEVSDMIAGQGPGGRAADEVLGKVMLRGGIMTVENVAANAVMAGARPQHFPVILAAMEAYVNGWEDNKLFYRDVMSNDQRSLAMIVSGPIVGNGEGQLDLGRGRMLGTGSDDSAVIGRAVMLAIRNIGHIAFENSAVLEGVARFNHHELYVLAEANEYLPDGWITLSENMGFGDGSNTVTLIAVSRTRFTSGVGGTAAGGTAGSFDAFTTHRTQATATTLFNSPGIFVVHWRDAHQSHSRDTRAQVAGGYAATARGLATKDALRQWIAGTGGNPVVNGTSPVAPTRNVNREGLVWPIVAGYGHSTQGRVFHGGSADYNDSRGFHTQRIGGTSAPSAPQGFTVDIAIPGQAVLTWTAPVRGTVTAYEISSDGGRTWQNMGANLTATIVGLDAGQYFFAVRARSEIQNSVDVRAPGAGGVAAARLDWNSSGRGAWAWDIAVVAAPPATLP